MFSSLKKIINRGIKKFKPYIFVFIANFHNFFFNRKDQRDVIVWNIAHQERFAFFLVYALAKKYRIELKDMHYFYFFVKYLGLKNVISHINFANKISDVSNKIILYDEMEKTTLPDNFSDYKRRIKIDHNYFTHNEETDDILIMPFSLHPLNYRRKLYNKVSSESTRKHLIFFAGNCDKELYTNRFNFPIMNRVEIIETIIENFKDEIFFIKTNKDMEKINHTDKKIILSLKNYGGHTNYILTMEKYLKIIEESYFSICPPGVAMPFSHNLIESMLTGTVPITNYGDYFYPKLKKNENIISFYDKNSLINEINRVLTMPVEEILELQKNVRSYYGNSLKLESFFNKFEQNNSENLTIAVNSEHLTVKLFKQAQ